MNSCPGNPTHVPPGSELNQDQFSEAGSYLLSAGNYTLTMRQNMGIVVQSQTSLCFVGAGADSTIINMVCLHTLKARPRL